jgi:hydrogenase maturation factor
MTDAVDRESCVTCGDVAVAARVLAVHGAAATVEVESGLEEVGIELVTPVVVGDLLLCHAGIALQKVASETAQSPGPPSSSPL